MMLSTKNEPVPPVHFKLLKVAILAVADVIVKEESHCVRFGPALASGSGIKDKTNDLV